jgi:YgiT-type zinc finger domain-containing protein
MNGEEMKNQWDQKSADIMRGMVEWQAEHPQATLCKIEAEVDKRLSGLRVRMLTDAAMEHEEKGWQEKGAYGVCPNCGVKLEKKGKKKRKLQTQGGQEVELEREYAVCPECGQGILPPG